MADSPPLFWSVIACITALKFLLLQSYRSTDFEVHRNWLAITHNLPKEKWYYESTSVWTLDYPPFFAWFEYALSHVAKYFDPGMLRVENLNYSSDATVKFQRTSVIVTDLLYAYAVRQCCNLLDHGRSRGFRVMDIWADDRFILCMILLTNIGLLIVDHIHFQYNGFLFGVLLLSIARMVQNRYLEAALWFAVLLNLKHIFLYVAPAYFVYLLLNYCLTVRSQGRMDRSSFSIGNFIKLAVVVAGIFSLSFGPFVIQGQLTQILKRLFPFKRGITHSYWAPNFWALYNAIDKVATFVGFKLGLIGNVKIGAMTSGIVQEYEHTVLPSVSPILTLAVTALAMLPSLFMLWKRPGNPWEFVRCLVLCAFASFMFGWHVHEKAILMIIIPLSLLAMLRKHEARIFLFLSTVGHYSLFPLLFKEAEAPTRLLLILLYTSYAFYSFYLLYRTEKTYSLPLLSIYESVYILGLAAVHCYAEFIHHFILGQQLPFLPLLLTSVYCGCGVTYCWIKLNWIAWRDKSRDFHEKLN